MSLFQKSVLQKHLKVQDKELIAKAYKKYQKYFHNTSIQENIRSSKEEQFQAKFLDELFVNIFGYTLSPKPQFNLTTELKNEKDSKKADGAILKDGQAIGVIELKGTKSKDLEKVRQQAFNYKANQTGCVYVITSNFEKLRFYINNAVDFEEFNLFTINEERFALMYLCLAKENVFAHLPLKIKEDSVQKEEQITKTFYSDYSVFKRELFRDLVKNNLKNEVFRAELTREDSERGKKNIKQTLFKKSQKLIDRFLFIFFAEDRGLLPPNSTLLILENWDKLNDLDASMPLYDRYKLYFNYLDKGRTGTPNKAEIFAYNGGLFKPDSILDSLIISDELLYKHTKKLQAYDFESQVDVNILGHIFENSLNEIESVNAEIEGTNFDKQKTKRKKDGVFYTPKYITKYIVDNTVGKLCFEKKEELGIVEEEYFKSRKGRTKAKLKELLDKVEAYREWLLQITILDPACGSGAFLNQALDFLIKEHQYIDELQTNLLGGGFVFPDVENTVLENNIYGVDLNEESVEIAKLSLWLRTAQPRRKLNTLNNNIKCGNSLVDSKAVAGDKAFKWEEEFSEIFAKGGFDVVIGNPPYVFTRGNEHLQLFNNFIWTNYNHNHGKINLYSVFLELSIKRLLNDEGKLGFITPETFIRTSTYAEIRRFLINNHSIESISIYGMGVFENVTAETITMIIKKELKDGHKVFFIKHKSIEDFDTFIEEQAEFNQTPENRFVYGSNKADKYLFTKLKKDKILLGDFIDVRNGIATKSGKNNYLSTTKINEKYKELLEAPNLFRYGFEWPGVYINYDKEVLHRPRKEETFLANKILIQRVSSRLICSYDDNKFYTFNSVNNLVLKAENSYDLKLLLGILNSKLIDLFYRRNYSLGANFTITVTKTNLDSIPIPAWDIADKTQQAIIKKVDKVLLEIKSLVVLKNNFLNLLRSKFEIAKLSTKLKNWHKFEFKDFLKELKKVNVQLSLAEEAQWMQYFNEENQKAQKLKSEIDRTDTEIDRMVYELYGLTGEEIKIIEGASD